MLITIGQNKNNAMVQYVAWRVLTKRNISVSLSFLLTGHTKLAPDRFFGLIKKVYRRSAADTLQDLGRIVTESTIAGKNIPEYTVDMLGRRNVTWYDWTAFLAQFFKRIPNITKYHHFSASDSDPGTILMKAFADRNEESLGLMTLNLRDLMLPGSGTYTSTSGNSVAQTWQRILHVRNPSFRNLRQRDKNELFHKQALLKPQEKHTRDRKRLRGRCYVRNSDFSCSG